MPDPASWRGPEIERTIVIARPLEEVWEYIADLRNDPQWCDKVVSVKQLVGDGPGPNTSYRVVHQPVRLKQSKELAVTVEEFEPPRRMRMREENGEGVFSVTYGLEQSHDLERSGEATRLTQRDRIEWKVPRPQVPMARRMVGRDIENQLLTLKSLLESGQAMSEENVGLAGLVQELDPA
ncbi:MAG TPA: SRPBCC family protein [Solirubrobacterales bacterium]|nr:SRPBCC family protein [Solirubrobacterales bacterium]